MSTLAKPVRAMILFNGHVQGVGFRYSCRLLAKGFSVTGCVKNLEDGRVEMTVEGEHSEIEEFLKAIHEDLLGSLIRQHTLDWQPATGEWNKFYILH